MEKTIKLNEIYTAQGYKDELIIEDKRENKDYEITVEMIDDDGEIVAILVDGNHSLKAAQLDGVEPEIKICKINNKNLVEYVKSMNDLSNPVNIITGKDLW